MITYIYIKQHHIKYKGDIRIALETVLMGVFVAAVYAISMYTYF